MAVENELVYIIRLTPEGEQEVVRANRVIDQTGKKVEKVDKNFGSYKKTVKSAGKSSKNFSKQSSSASNALLDLTRVAQDAPYGIRGVANNLEQAAASSARAFQSFGSFKGMLSGLGSALIGPLGIVAGVTALTTLGPKIIKWFGLFESGAQKVEEARRQTELYQDAISREIDARLDDNQSISEQVQALNTAIDSLTGYNDIKKLANTSLQKSLDLYEKNNKALENANRLTSAQSDALYTNTSAYDEILSQQKNIDDEVLKILNKRRAELKATQLVRKELDKLGIIQEKISDGETSAIETIDIDTSLVEDDSASSKLKQLEKRQLARIKEQGRARMQFEQSLEQMRLNVVKSASDKIAAIRAEEQMKIRQITNNELITKRQQQEAITLIEKQYANKRAKIAEQEARKKQQAEAAVNAARLNLATQVTNSLQGLGSVIAGESEENAKKRFEADKAFNYAAAIMNTAAGVTKALSAAPPPVNFINASAVGAAGALQVAKIASTKYKSAGGASGNGSSVGYRGIGLGSDRVQNPSRQSPGQSGRPDRGRSEGTSEQNSRKVLVLDDLGNVVTTGLEKIEAAGGTGYVRGG